MARGRMIAKTLSTSEKRASLHSVAGKLAEFAQALYPLLVAHADDFGREQGDTFTVKHAVDPTSPRSLADFEKALTALATVGLIAWYEADGRKVIEINQFSEHQPGLKQRGASKFLGPDDGVAVGCREVPRNAVDCPELPSEEKGREQNRTEGKGTEGNSASAPLSEVPGYVDPSAPECKVEAVMQLWNELTVGTKLPACRGLSEKRRAHIRARMKEHGLGTLRDVMVRVAGSDFCNGVNDRGWVMSFDWLMESSDHVLRVTEGKYDNRTTASQAPASTVNTQPTAKLRELRALREAVNS